MRKKVLLLVLALASVAALAGTFAGMPAEAGTNHSCPICTTYADGSKCCVSCICDSSGHIVACTDHFCPDGIN